ncbi:DUF975 family protein [Prevotella sp. S7 MS 2]|uniref:DUF975 family protein n=1 Tax=Prevotella sp. S7 MS 2 TaxID=1287488 RepID=UPI000512F144|nr:DUF975 family protein [Prevotella sp. S7 MS 2]KGI60632.1 hypothetical protein HMPREF0671_04845 [Prevotella sp. S7 MS 2]
MDSLSNYRNRALASLENNWGKAVIVTIVVLLISLLFQGGIQIAFSFGGKLSKLTSNIFAALILIPISWAFNVFFLRMLRGENLGVKNLFDGFSDYGRILLAIVLKNVYIFLWTLLLIVPGIYKSFSYALTEFVLLDHPEMNGEQAIKESMRLMDGRKMALFLLLLSFIGWLILSFITLGLGFIFLFPYVQTAMAHFYEDAVKEDGASISD